METAMPLLSAAVAGLVAWLVVVRQSNSTRENWVRDRRYAAYQETIDAGIALQNANARLIDIAVEAARFTDALAGLRLIAPYAIRKLARKIDDDVFAGAVRGDGREQFEEDVRRLTGMLRDDLVPMNMR